MVIKNLYNSSIRNLKSDCALGLGAISIWILNGLYRRPDDRFIKLAEEACQHIPTDYEDYEDGIEIDDPDAIMPLMYEAGLYFVCDIVQDKSDTLRLPFHKAISDQAFQNAFRLPITEVRQIMGTSNHNLPRTLANIERTANRSKRRTLDIENIRPADRSLPHMQETFLNDIKQRPSKRMRGPDVDHFAQHGGGNRDAQVLLNALQEDDQDTATKVKLILEQVFYDILMESPNKKAAHEGAWTNIPMALRNQEANEDLYLSFGLPFFAAQYTFCDQDQWSLHFDRLFPERPPLTKTQNFSKCTYFIKWIDLLQSLSVASISRVRAAIKAKFNTLLWIPYTGSDRMWSTRPMKGRGWYSLPSGQPPSGPQIAFNPRTATLAVGKPFLRSPPIPLDDTDDHEEEEGVPFQPEDHISPFNRYSEQPSDRRPPAVYREEQEQEQDIPQPEERVPSHRVQLQYLRREEEEEEEELDDPFHQLPSHPVQAEQEQEHEHDDSGPMRHQ